MVSRVRIRFRKQDDLRLIGHRDLMRTVERLFRRAGVAVCETEGFHPKPRFHYPASLALGMRGSTKCWKSTWPRRLTPDELLARLNAQYRCRAGVHAHRAPVEPDARKDSRADCGSKLRLSPELAASLSAETERVSVPRRHGMSRERTSSVDIRPLVEELSIVDGVLAMRLTVVNEQVPDRASAGSTGTLSG